MFERRAGEEPKTRWHRRCIHREPPQVVDEGQQNPVTCLSLQSEKVTKARLITYPRSVPILEMMRYRNHLHTSDKKQ